MTIEDTFRQAMSNAGIITNDPIIADGKLRRFHVEGDRPGSKNGWHVLFNDGIPAGRFGSWKLGGSETWCAKETSKLSTQEKKDFTRQMKAAGAEREQEEKRIHAKAQAHAIKIWDDSKPAPASHGYLKAKQVKPHGLRVAVQGTYKDWLVVPLYDTKGVIHSLQYIAKDGTKKFLAGGQVSGHHFSLGELNGDIYITEGFSTAATEYEIIKGSVVAAFHAGNLKAVAKALRKEYPNAQIIIAGDNDRQTEGNPGRTYAIEAARAVGGLVALPVFKDGQAGTDFNDLLIAEGQQVVKQQLEAAAPPPLSNNLQAEVDNWLAGNSTELTDILEPLKSMPLLQREQYRKRICEKADIRTGIFDELVKSRESQAEVQGGVIGWENIVPWTEPVNGASLLDELVTTFQRYIVLPEGAAETIALWTVHTHAHEAAFISPYLALVSPEKRCGKTHTLELLSSLVPKPLPASNITPSVTSI